MSTRKYEGVDNLTWTSKVITQARFRPYLHAMNGNTAGALELYILNVRVSAELYSWLGFLEIALRNALVAALRRSEKAPTNDPFESHWQTLAPETRWAYQKALKRLSTKGKSVSFDTLISELPFGYWRYLLSAKYESTLWTSHLRHAFPGLKVKRRAEVYSAIENIVYLRNRIAHHEPIFRRELGTDLRQIQQIIGWISPEALDWARVNLPTHLIVI